MMSLDGLRERLPPFARLLELELLSAEADELTGRLAVRPELCTTPSTLHGGAIMAMADTLGAAATVLNLPPGTVTTTLESKTNFLAAAPVGEVVTAVCTPLHRGRSTMVWQTRISRADGRLVAVVTQTQMVLPVPRP